MEGPLEIDGMGYVNQYGLSRKASTNTSVLLIYICGFGIDHHLAYLRLGQAQSRETTAGVHRPTPMHVPSRSTSPPWLMVSSRSSLRPEYAHRRDCEWPAIYHCKSRCLIRCNPTQMQALHDVVKAGWVRYIGMSSCFAYQCTLNLYLLLCYYLSTSRLIYFGFC
jgi:hypothetical protein